MSRTRPRSRSASGQEAASATQAAAQVALPAKELGGSVSDEATQLVLPTEVAQEAASARQAAQVVMPAEVAQEAASLMQAAQVVLPAAVAQEAASARQAAQVVLPAEASHGGGGVGQ